MDFTCQLHVYYNIPYIHNNMKYYMQYDMSLHTVYIHYMRNLLSIFHYKFCCFIHKVTFSFITRILILKSFGWIPGGLQRMSLWIMSLPDWQWHSHVPITAGGKRQSLQGRGQSRVPGQYL